MRTVSGDMTPTLCPGEAIVDLICDWPGASCVEADRFDVHLGGDEGVRAVGRG